MKIIILIVSLIALISLHAFADTYTITLDAEQDSSLLQCAEEVHMLPDDFIQELVSDYVDGIIDEEIQTGFKQLTKHERRAIARRYLKKNTDKSVRRKKKNKK